ncbi:MAG: helix-turn-helix domain-containing protein [Bacteroidota bacterium]
MKEYLTVQVNQKLLIQVIQIAEKKKSCISSLVKDFMQWIVKNEDSLDCISFHERQPEQNLDDYIKEVEKAEILDACEYAHSKRELAKILGISYRACRYRLDAHKIVFEGSPPCVEIALN